MECETRQNRTTSTYTSSHNEGSSSTQFQIGLTSLSYHGIIQPLGRLRVSLIVHYNPYKTSREKIEPSVTERRETWGEASRRVVYFVHAQQTRVRLLALLRSLGASEDLKGACSAELEKCVITRETGSRTLNNAEAGTGLALVVGVSVDSGIALDVDSSTTISLSV